MKLLFNYRLSNFFALALSMCFIFPGLALSQEDDKTEKDEPKVESKEDQDDDSKDEDSDDEDSDDKDADDKKKAEPKKPTLTIGSKAPSIDISDWISDNDGLFEHITEFESGHVYVIEFTTVTLPGAGRLMMINSDLQEKFENDDVQIISIWAQNRRFIENFLDRDIPNDSQGRTIGELTNGYCVATDKDRSVAKDFHTASGQTQIPMAFIVGKTGVIEWIGSPFQMSDPLEKIVNDDWDREKFLPIYTKKLAEQTKIKEDQEVVGKVVRKIQPLIANDDFDGAAAEFTKAIEKHKDNVELAAGLSSLREQVYSQKIGLAVREDIQAADHDSALEKIEAMIEESQDEDFSFYVTKVRINFLARFRRDEAADSMQEFVDKNNDDSEQLNNLSWELYELHESQGIDMAVLKVCKKAAERAVKLEPKKGYILDTLSHLVYAVDGDLDKAIELQKKAVELSENQRVELQEFLDKLVLEKKTGKKKRKEKPLAESDF